MVPLTVIFRSGRSLSLKQMGTPVKDLKDQPYPETVDIVTRIERLERTVALLVGAALEDACQGLTPEQLGESRAAAVQAMVATAAELRAAS